MSLPTNFFIGRGGGSAITLQLDTSQTFYNGYNFEENRRQDSSEGDGAARIVLNGYGILFYGWVAGSVNLSRNIQLPPELINKTIDIEAVGVGGGSISSGGGGGTAGGAGIRAFYTPTSDSFKIRTGSTLSVEAPPTAGQYGKANLGLYTNSNDLIISIPHERKEGNGANATAGTGVDKIYITSAATQSRPRDLSTYGGPARDFLDTSDTQWRNHVSYGGHGVNLNGFGSILPDDYIKGGGLGGGGGAQDASNYGGSNAGGLGGRYGYRGGYDNGDGYGPIGGKGYQRGVPTYTPGAGGAFGGGTGDAGNASADPSAGAGAILIRWDTTPYGQDVGFQSGRPGWP